MVRVRLLGSLRRAAGTPELSLETTRITAGQLLNAVQDRLPHPPEYRLDSSNTLVLVNGVEISALQQLETMVPSDADVVLIPVVHGGVRRVPLDGDNMVSILFCMRAKVSKPAVFLALLRSRVPGCLVQAFDAQSIGGLAHLAAVTRQTWEAKRRGHMLSRSAELDLIMRAAAHRQIKTALSAVGLRPGRPLVAIVVIGPRQHVAGLSCKDLGLLEPTRSAVRAGRRIRRDRLTATERRSAVGADAEALLLAEQAALLVR